MHTSFIFARRRKLLWASLLSWLDIVCPCRWLSTAPSTLRSSLAPNCSGLALQFLGVALTVSYFHLVSVVVFRCNCCAWCLGLLESGVPFHPCSLAPPFSSTKEIPVGWGPLAGLPWIPPPHARALPGSTNFVGTNAQAHLLVMSLNVAKCNLGKVNLEAMLVSCFPSYIRGGPMSLAGAPRDLYTQLLACSSSQSVVAIACCLRASLCFGFSHPSLPLGVG